MDIYFKCSKVAKLCNSESDAKKLFGTQVAKKLKQRLFELKAVETLSDIYSIKAARCHQLIGNRKGQFSVDLARGYRLVFEPRGEVPRKEDGGIDNQRVREINIVEVVDYHD